MPDSPMTSAGPVSSMMQLIDAFDEISRLVKISDEPMESTRGITQAAVAVIPGCSAASISLMGVAGPETASATDELAEAGDRIQYAEGEGPCIDAAMSERYVVTRHLAEDERWPRSSARIAHELGVGSMLACRLATSGSPDETIGAFNLYAREEDAFSDDDVALAIVLASYGCTAIEASRKQANLHVAIASRQVIGEAVGILRAQSSVSREEAFDFLVRASQRMNIKLRSIAEDIVERTPVTASSQKQS